MLKHKFANRLLIKTQLTLFSFFAFLSNQNSFSMHEEYDIEKRKALVKDYGGEAGDQYFNKRSASIVEAAALQLGKFVEYCRNKIVPLSICHKNFLGLTEKRGLAQARREIALTTNPEDGADFGVYRSEHGKGFYTAPIPGKYGKWRKDTCELFTKVGPANDKWIVEGNSRYKIKKLPQRPEGVELQEYIHLLSECAPTEEIANKRRELMFSGGMSSVLSNVYKLEMNIRIGNTYIPTTSIYYAIARNMDGEFPDNASREKWMNEESNILAVHAYPDYLEILLQEAGKHWQNAIEWNKQDITGLQENLANYCYIMAHSAPFKRGSASILEWVLQATARYHGYKIDWGAWGNIDQEALVQPSINQFRKQFKQKVRFSPLLIGNELAQRNKS